LCTVFGGLENSNKQSEKSLNSSIELPTSSIDEEFDDSNLKVWNLAGMTTDSETFD
jgi:hypothetical protein